MGNLTAPYQNRKIYHFKEGKMNELKIHEHMHLGDRTDPMIGVAHFRLVKEGSNIGGTPKKGDIIIWDNTMVTDKNDPEQRKVLAYRYPFKISCERALGYPEHILMDFRRTRLHLIPIRELEVKITRRKRTMSQEDFKQITDLARRLK